MLPCMAIPPDIRARIERFAAAAYPTLMGTRRKLAWPLNDFPRGMCGPVSWVVAKILAERLSVHPNFVSAWTTDVHLPGENHTWIEIDGLIVDLTHEQFPTAELGEVWVFEDSAWHAGWQVCERWSFLDDPKPERCNPVLYELLRSH